MASVENGTGVGSDTEVLQFNLTDPDHLSQQLESANLNEEETDILLSEALKLNAQLKEALKFQQLEETRHSAKGNRKKVGQSYGHGHPLAPPMAPRNPRPSNLPPIRHPGEPSRAGKKPHSPSEKKKGGSASGSRRKGSAKKRPEWDDRFSFG